MLMGNAIADDHPPGSKPSIPFYLILFTVLTLLLGTAGFFFYRVQERDILRQQHAELSAITELKLSQIETWRRERLADAEFILRAPIVAESVQEYFLQSSDPLPKEKVRQLLLSLSRQQDYENVILLDREGSIRLQVGSGRLHLGAYVLGLAGEAMREKSVVFSDLHLGENTSHVHIDLIAPLVLRQGGTAIGVLVIQIDPAKFLYPRLQAWPTPSPTGETLLFRREGKDVVYLNELRHQKDAAFELRIPADRPELPAAMALRGAQGIVNGVDYRGVPVIASLRKVPYSPWHLISKIDVHEAYAPIRERAFYISVIVILLITGSGTAAGYLWRRQSAVYYRALYEVAIARQEDRKRAEASLRESEKRYRLLFDRMMTGFALHEAVWDAAGDACDYRFLEVNQEFERLTGLSAKEIIGRTVREVLPGIEPVWIERYCAVARTGQPAHFEDFAGPLGKYFEVVAYSPQEGLFATIFSDITDRRRNEQALKKTTDELMRSNKELEQFAYIASHDLQEPLRMVASYMQLIEKRYKDRLDQDAQEFIDYAVDGAVRMQRMVNDLLVYSRVGTTGKPFVPVDSGAVLDQVLDDLKLKIEENDAVVTRGPLPAVLADASQLGQVFQNLIANAIKFRSSRPPQVHIHALQAGGEWVFSVKDNGIGFDPEYAEKIFVIFKRLYPMEKYPGSGIGLTICKKIVERHGGRIWAESQPGKGAVFLFTLPATGEGKAPEAIEATRRGT